VPRDDDRRRPPRYGPRKGVPWPWEAGERGSPAGTEGGPYNPITKLSRWLRGAFGLTGDEVPRWLKTDYATPVVELRQPEPRVFVWDDDETPDVVVPAGESWQPTALGFEYEADANVGDREMKFFIEDPTESQPSGLTGFLYTVVAARVQTATEIVQYSWTWLPIQGDTGAVVGGVTANVLVPMAPALWVVPGTRLRVANAGGFVGDEFRRSRLAYLRIPV
jgi:hypothetical protein